MLAVLFHAPSRDNSVQCREKNNARKSAVAPSHAADNFIKRKAVHCIK